MGGERMDPFIDAVLVEGLDDWVDAAWVQGTVWSQISTDRGYGPMHGPRTLAIGVIAEVVSLELMRPGDLGVGGHLPWECSRGDAIVRIVAEWLAKWPGESDAPSIGDIVWLANTPEGDARARAALAAREGPV